MTDRLKRGLLLTLPLASLCLGFMVPSAQAANVTITNYANHDIKFYFSCIFPDGHQDTPDLFTVKAGQALDAGGMGCGDFIVKFDNSRGRFISYQLQAGQKYKFMWEADKRHYDMEPDDGY